MVENVPGELIGERVSVVEGPFIAETDNVVEEVQAVEGFELPPGQQPQGLLPQPPQQAVAQPAPVFQQGYSGNGGYGSGSYGN